MTHREGGKIEGEPAKYQIRRLRDGRLTDPVLAEYATLEEAMDHPARPDMVLAVCQLSIDPIPLKPNHLRQRS